jgi:ABC-type dipeptide/oligopeptide/nickel transport system permease subunit
MIWATLIIVFSAVSFVGMGGYFIGAILGILGGAFDLSIRPINP